MDSLVDQMKREQRKTAREYFSSQAAEEEDPY